MKQSASLFVLLVAVFCSAPFCMTPGFGDEPVGIAQRTPWTTSQIHGTPEPPLPYITKRAFPKLQFNKCIDMATPPGSQRLFVLEQSGKLFSFPADQEMADSADLTLDIAAAVDGVKNAYALTFHPDFQKNGYCYVCCIKAPNLADGSQIVRFRMRNTDPPTLDPSSQKLIIQWPSGGHNGCCLKFGPDGYLYISTGDGVGPNPPDPERSGQDVTNLLSCILRIDVDHQDDGRNYRIPKDNPFVDLEGARGEIWAYGFRNPWRMSFDAKTGDLWVGDVGWELWELLDRVERGGNYGWSVMEGRQPTNTEFPRGPTEILPPTIDHPHSESSSITDGLTYYGDDLPDLHGHHIYGDYDTGKMWAFRWHDGQVEGHREISDTSHRIVGYAEDHRGRLYLLDHIGGTLHRLAPNPTPDESEKFPRRLSETGLFSSTKAHAPAPGVIAYSISAEPWADHATAQRWVAIPGEATAQAANVAWKFPEDSVLVKTLSMEMEQGEPKSQRRLETQILHFDGEQWRPYTFRWNKEQTDAALVDPDGDQLELQVRLPAKSLKAPDGVRHQVWQFSGRGECQRCHNKWSGPPLGFNTALLNRTHTYRSSLTNTKDSREVDANQLDTFAHIGLVRGLPEASKRPALADPYDESKDLDARARAYLQVNCAHCHRMHAGGAVVAKMHYDIELKASNMVGVRPSQGTFGIHGAQVIAPNDPFRSVLFYRMSKLGGGRMPRIGSHLLDEGGIRLIQHWIENLPPTPGVQVGNAELDERNAELISQLPTLKSTDPNLKMVTRGLLESTSGAFRLQRAVDERRVSTEVARAITDIAARHAEPQIRDLFEPYLPLGDRVQRLGAVIQPSQVLSLQGDVKRGQAVFAAESVSCKNCHRIGPEGPNVGPELTLIGKRLTKEQLLESVLAPSRRIDPKYITYLVETEDGRALTGLLEERNQDHIVLRDARNQRIQLPLVEVERIVPQATSLMPELLLQDMTAQQAADLLAYLTSLK